MRSRVSSPAASRPASSAGKASGGTGRSLDINISLCLIRAERKRELTRLIAIRSAAVPLQYEETCMRDYDKDEISAALRGCAIRLA